MLIPMLTVGRPISMLTSAAARVAEHESTSSSAMSPWRMLNPPVRTIDGLPWVGSSFEGQEHWTCQRGPALQGLKTAALDAGWVARADARRVGTISTTYGRNYTPASDSSTGAAAPE